MDIICVTHSDRLFLEEKGSINAINKRFSKDRLFDLPEFQSYNAESKTVPYQGNLTIWKLDKKNTSLSLMMSYSTDSKIQFATFYRDKLFVLCSSKIEILDIAFNCVATITDPWLVGGHTLYINNDGKLVVTSAPSNSVLIIDPDTHCVEQRINMPSQYGIGHKLTTKDDLHLHYIPTDYQPTHVNSAVPVNNGLLLTLWIQGSVIYMEKSFFFNRWESREILSGIRGCHCARMSSVTGEVYVSDSAAGLIWFVDFESGDINRRLKIESNWLHDACQIDESIIVAGLSDKNEIRLIDNLGGHVLGVVDCSPFGESVMFVNYCQPEKLWESTLENVSVEEENSRAFVKLKEGPEILPRLYDFDKWDDTDLDISMSRIYLHSDRALACEALYKSKILNLEPGIYRLHVDIRIRKGFCAVGVFDTVQNELLDEIRFTSREADKYMDIIITEPVKSSVILSAANTGNKRETVLEIIEISFKKYSGENASENRERCLKLELEPEGNLLSPLRDMQGWFMPSLEYTSIGQTLKATKVLKYEYMLRSKTIFLEEGEYRLSADLYMEKGGVVIGVLDYDKNEWIVQLNFNRLIRSRFIDFKLDKACNVQAIVAACNQDEPEIVDVDLVDISLCSVDREWVLEKENNKG